ncbi:MAG: diguanylate cyclase [Actinomycetota bacterium]
MTNHGRPGPDALAEGVVWDIAQLLVSERSPDRVLEAVADALQDLVPHDTITVYQADAPLRLLRPVLCRDTYAEQILAMGAIPFGTGLTGGAVESGEPALVNDAHLDSRAQQIAGTPAEPESMIAIPLVARGEPKGALCLYRLGEQNHFTREEFELAIRFGGLAALAIDDAETRAQLEAEVVTDHLTGLYSHRYFHERLAEELRRSSRNRSEVGLLICDLDDFKRVNDIYGHQVGDQVLQGVATLLRETCRSEDVLCRIGGEEFAVIVPGGGLDEVTHLAERLWAKVGAAAFPVPGRVTVSVGVAAGPHHATGPRDLVGCAELALMEAKAGGKDRVHVYGVAAPNGNAQGHQDEVTITPGEVRSAAHLKMLQSLAAKLNQLNDVNEIAEAITVELRSLIDYHNCRVHLLAEDGKTLVPLAFLGTLLEYQGESFDALLTEVGEGITGHVAATGKALLLDNARDFEGAVQIQGTPDVDESVLVVPLRYGDRVTGTVFLSKLGVGQFDHQDLRLLEVLASNAAVALENARLLQTERESAASSRVLLQLSRMLTAADDVGSVLREALEAIPPMLGCTRASAWTRDPQTGVFRVVAHTGYPDQMAGKLEALAVPREVASEFLQSAEEPFVLTPEVMATVPPEWRMEPGAAPVLVAPMTWEPRGLGTIVVAAPDEGFRFTDRHLRLARGIADTASLALGNASRFDELEDAYLSTVEALANALEAQDEYTHSHARSLAEMSLAIGESLGFEGERLKTLELAALFHDIGKIGVPSEIIRKSGPLSAEERRSINRHPEIGERILEPVPFLQSIRPIIRACHERFDGKGYPDGLVGEQIPIEARIVFVCDAFHAMTTDRPYRAALPEREAIRRLRLSADTQFDPAVVEAFVRLHAAGGVGNGHAAA